MPWMRLARLFLLAALPAVVAIALELLWTRQRAEESLIREVSTRITARVAELERTVESLTEANFEHAATHNVFLLSGDSLVRWSEHDFLPDFGKVRDSLPLQFVVSGRSNFLALQKSTGRGRVVAVINLQHKYPINNRYLATGLNPALFPISEGHLVPVDALVGLPVTVGGAPLFRLAPLNLPLHPAGTLWLFTLAAVLFVLAVVVTANHLSKSSTGGAVVFVAVAFIALRFLQLAFAFPRTWVTSSLFDPQVFASSYLNFSLGDLLINSLLVLGIIAYAYVRWLPGYLNTASTSQPGPWRQFVIFLLLTFTVLYPYLFFESIYHNSNLTVDITDSLRIDANRVVLWLAIVAGICASWLAFTGLVRLLGLRPGQMGVSIASFVGAVLVFLAYAYFEERTYQIPVVALLAMAVATVASARYWQLDARWQVLLAIVFSGYAAAAVYYLGEERKTESQLRFANNYLASRDELGEFLLNEVNTKIRQDPFIISVWNNPLRNRTIIKEKIKRVYLQNYFDQYEVTIQLFESSGENLEAAANSDLASFLLSHKVQSVPTGYEGVFIRRAPDLPSARNYRVITRVGRGARMAGFIVVDLNLKRAIPESVFPEVLLDEKRIQSSQFGTYSYAWWEENQILNRFGTFDYQQLDVQRAFREERFAQLGYWHQIVREENGRWLVVSRPTYSVAYAGANFCFFLLLLGAAWSVAVLVRQREMIFSGRSRTFAQRLQVATLASAIIPFLVMAFVFFQMIRRENRQQLNSQFVQRAVGLAEVVQSQLAQVESADGMAQVRRLTDLDFSVFDKHGILITTNQPAVYDQGVLSRLLAPTVLERVRTQSPWVRDERIGTLAYKTSYLAIRNNRGEPDAVLAVPFFDYDRSNERAEIRTINWLLVLFVGIGMFAVVLSMRLTRQLVSPLRWMADKLRETTFQKSPSLINWERKDELGALVDAYNRMLNNWTEAKQQLSQQEKERAWREMARQVAHEIKNPLTPMKLTLQQMQMLQSRQELSHQKIADSVSSLLHQVDLLSEIATSFSTFAGMPQPKFEKLEVLDLVNRTVHMYRDSANGQAEIHHAMGPFHVWADEKIVSRVFSNLLLNAWQSADRPVNVRIHVERVEERVRITFADDGPGIAADVQSKIFVPYFTTKKSGSGLGLAISKQGIESCNGAIRFSSVEGAGTTFEIELPAYRPDA